MPASSTHPADQHDVIRISGAREHNLNDVSLSIPKRRLTAQHLKQYLAPPEALGEWRL